MHKIKFIGGAFLIAAFFNLMTVENLWAKPADMEADRESALNIVEEEIDGRMVKIAADQIVVKYKEDTEPFRVIDVPAGEVEAKIAEFAKRADVEYAEPNYIAEAQMAPNDTLYGRQWNFQNGPGGLNLESAWELATGEGVVVAVVDTGIAYENYGSYIKATDLAQTCFVAGYDFINNDAHPNDDKGHGTHVAGTIAQSTNNSLGVAGIAYDACLMPVKVLDQYGQGAYTQVADGIRYAADNGAQVINLSLGGTMESEVLRDAVLYAYNQGVVLVAAAGNGGSSTLKYPAAYPEVISVGATRYDTTLATYSSYGPDLDFVAPGGDLNVDQNNDGYPDGVLQQTFEQVIYFLPPQWNYYYYQGTSMATPHITGTIALVKSVVPEIGQEDLATLLAETARDLGDAGRDDTYGWGFIDPWAALMQVAVPNTPPVSQDQFVTTDEDLPAAITLQATDLENDTLIFSLVNLPTHGNLSGQAPNLTYTPDLNYYGVDAFTFKASDGRAVSNVATVSLLINPVNDPPLADAGPDQSGYINATINFDASGSSDPEGSADIVAYAWDFGDGQTASGVSASHIYPAAGEYTVVLKVTDQQGLVGQDLASVNIGLPNTAPVAFDQQVTLDEDASVAIMLETSDAESDPLSYTIGAEPVHGLLSGEAPNVTYTPSTNYFGADAFTFKANDGKLDSNLATVTLTINPVNDPPVANAGPDQSGYANIALNFDGSASSDIEGAIAAYQWDFGDGGQASGAQVSHGYVTTGIYTVTLTVTDSDAATAQDMATVNIQDVNPAIMYVSNIGFTYDVLVKYGILKYYKVYGRVTVLNGAGQPVEGASVNVTWSGAYSKTTSVTTDSNGVAMSATPWIMNGGTFNLKVNSITKSGMTYTLERNLETSDSIVVPQSQGSSTNDAPPMPGWRSLLAPPAERISDLRQGAFGSKNYAL